MSDSTGPEVGPEAKFRPASETPAPGAPEALFRPQLLVQWFVIPLLVVGLCVGLYLSFRLLMLESKTTEDYLNELRSGNPHRAWQAAFALANQVNLGRLPEHEQSAVGRQLLEMLDQSSAGAGEIRHYLILTLGRLRYSEAVPRLLALADGADATEKIYALLALGEIKPVEAIDAVSRSLNDPDPGVRKTAAHLFAVLNRPLPAGRVSAYTLPPDWPVRLRPVLNDPVADVRWNAAISLAEFRDPAAIPVLAGMLDRPVLAAELKEFGGLDETKVEKIIKAALAASLQYRDAGLGGKIQTLAESDPNAAVQATARQALERLRGTN
ncbi:MAG: hypothetical protein A3G34_09460 [Candidatus Lindowbacteria bacterium RIFCSPLOWO2_12_FULL_62_27]|nr:MAG: hypothetical protein A3I06_08120 [Candidatus Lindowbacteria bacterium RIFCSPLOWO2_02_FULL_62_12]OGH60264.1 MAG: hypothetical protein A3G34_09460 [Candidatus Lindowbacteria bacterium RIFCSPLOWO2_12_FULL_62_27]